MSRRARPHYRPGLGWILGVAFGDTLTRPVRLAQGFTCVRCCGSPRASSPHGLTAPGPASHDGISLRAVASGSRLLPTRPAKDFHLQSSAHARHTSLRDDQTTAKTTGRGFTYPTPIPVQTNPATSRTRQRLSGEPPDTPTQCRQDHRVPAGRWSASSLRATRGLASSRGRKSAPLSASRLVTFYKHAARMLWHPQPDQDG
jgi:hypothetical protein